MSSERKFHFYKERLGTCVIPLFLLKSNPMSASLKSLGIFLNSRSKVNFNVKYDFSTNGARNKCNTSTLFDFDWANHL